MRGFWMMKNKASFFLSKTLSGDLKAKRKIFICCIVFGAVFSFRFAADKQRQSHFSHAIAASEVNQIKTVADTVSQEGIDVNSASHEALQFLPGIGPKLADAIIKSRKVDGPFREAGDLLRVKGIGVKKLEKMIPYLRFNSPGTK